MLTNFEIDPAYLTDVVDRIERDLIKDRSNPTQEELLDIIKGVDKVVVTSSVRDHEEFTKLRNQLEELGYIKTERGWWNGDKVLKSFMLNGLIVKKGDTFPCACVVGRLMRHARNQGLKTLTLY